MVEGLSNDVFKLTSILLTVFPNTWGTDKETKMVIASENDALKVSEIFRFFAGKIVHACGHIDLLAEYVDTPPSIYCIMNIA